MNSVFIGGSRRLARMNVEISRRVDNIVRRGLRVLIGDANGFDRAAQAELAARGYPSVLVYCTNGVCRNNIGNWPKHAVEYQGRERGIDFYTAKDDAMLRDADFGLFGWDGKSKGTLRNIRLMAEMGKPSAVYVAPIREFVSVRSTQDARDLLRYENAEVAVSGDLFLDASCQ